MKKKLLIVSIFLIIGLVVAFFLLPKSSPKISTIPIKVSLNWLHQARFAGFYTAKEKGFYQKIGLNPTFIEYNSDVSQIDLLKSGQADFAVINPLNLITAIDQGADIRAIAVIYEISPFSLAV